jgi:6-phospho-beta-glucosidase
VVNRITILGGSSVYIPEFVSKALAHNLVVDELVLLGKPGRKLDAVSDLCQRLVDKNGHATRIIAETNVEAAVQNASYVINHVRIGGMKARIRDEMTPPQLDMIGSDCIGAGAVINALRTLPVVMSFARTLEAVNSNAVFINLTNPVGVIVEALTRSTSLNVVGVNDLPGVYRRKIGALLGRSPADIVINCLGLHDLGWIQDVKVGGTSQMRKVLDLITDTEDEDFDHALINLFRLIPTRHAGLYFHRSEALKYQQSCARFRSQLLHDAEKRILRLYSNPALNAVPDLTRQRNPLWYEYTLIPLLKAFENSKPSPMVLCVQNQGAISDLPDKSSVEIPVNVSKKGYARSKIGMVPRFLKGFFCAIKESDRLVIEASTHKSYEHALQALVVNPFVPSTDKAREYLDRAIRQDNLELH